MFTVMFTLRNIANSIKNYHVSPPTANKALELYKYLLRECEKLPEAPRKHYKFMVKQSFKQHVKETDQERITQIMQRAHEDADWILKKYDHYKEIMLVPLASSGKAVQQANFHNVMQLYHDRPHLINKKLCSSTALFYYSVVINSSSPLTEIINYTSLIYETNKIQASNLSKDTLRSIISNLLLPYDKHVVIKETTPEDLKQCHNGVFVTVRILLPSNARCANTVEVAIFNYDENYVCFLAASTNDKFLLVAPPFPYRFQLDMQSNMLQLIVEIDDADTASGDWLADKLFPKILKWCDDCDVSGDRVVVQSLSLIDVEQYCGLYQRLKGKYGKQMVEIWPENTDPLKFVYEDVAIATYLICLWSGGCEIDETDKKPSFVDLGCGNGLLVHILSQEGYPGLGIDVRRRKIWDLYPDSTNLQVKTVIPSDANLFPTADWIIGNHSDELTPWIPVIAARSSPNTNFFLLPCCCYNFDGSKYRRINTAISQYSEYLQYVDSICNACGFTTDIDRLRIPSTKRTCLVGRGPKTLTNDAVNANISKLLGNTPTQSGDSPNQWVSNYQAREVEEKVRNCTKLDRNFVNTIVHKLVHTLLTCSPSDNVLLPRTVDGAGENANGGGEWNAGTCVDIVTLVRSLEASDLRQLKSECGGLQTLMRNHRYIFSVEKGRVQLRPPYLRSATSKYIGKQCWFRRNHPNGCLHSDVACAYSHAA